MDQDLEHPPLEPSKNHFYVLLGLVLIFLCIVAWYFYSINPGSSLTVNQTRVAVNVEQPPIVPSQVTSSETRINESVPEVKPVIPEPVISKQIDSSEFKCKWNDEPIKLFAHSPSKHGDYLHLDAKNAASACILDSSNKLTVVHLKEQEGQTIRGQQPFQVYSPQLSNFKIFYQGSVIRPPSSNTQNIALTEQKQ